MEKNWITVYVSNFLSHVTVCELWNIYECVGVDVDVFIAKKGYIGMPLLD